MTVGSGGTDGGLAVPAGWALVPIEPTQEMLEAALLAWDSDPPDVEGAASTRDPVEINLHREYSAMLAAAPKYAPP